MLVCIVEVCIVSHHDQIFLLLWVWFPQVHIHQQCLLFTMTT